MNEQIKDLVDRYTTLKNERNAVFDSGWQTISNYFLPQTSNINTQKTEGITGWTDRIYDNTAIQAAQTLRSGQRNWLTPTSEPWFQFEAPATMNVNDRDECNIWLGRATEIALKELQASNFYSMVNLDYLSIGVFGTGLMFCDDNGKRTTLNFRQFKIATYVIAEDDEGVVDTVFREFELTSRQAVQMFGISNVSDKIQKAYTNNQRDKKWKILHAVFPREELERDPQRADGAHKSVASMYIELEGNHLISEGGYDEMPYFCSRFDKWGTDSPYGYSPAYLCLPVVRQLNYIIQYVDALAELRAYPRLLYPDNLEDAPDLRAGGVTTYDHTEPDSKPQEWMTQGDYAIAKDMIQMKMKQINDAFYVTVFAMLEQLADKKMTAYEIAQRQAERLENFTAAFDRRVQEFLNPLLRRVFGVLLRAGKFGSLQEIPAGLVQTDPATGKASIALPEIMITSRIALALKSLRNTGMINTISALTPLVQVKPDILDNFDMDDFAKELGRNFGVPADMEIPLKKVMEVRAQRAQQQAQQQSMANMQAMAKTGADLGKAPQPMQDAMMSGQ